MYFIGLYFSPQTIYFINQMATLYPYKFNSTARIGADNTDRTLSNLESTRYNNHMLTSYFSENKSSDYVNFATSQPGISFIGSFGASNGIGASTVDVDSSLIIRNENTRNVGRTVLQTPGASGALDRLSLHQRPFLTVPYLGRGSCDPTLESQLMQGDYVMNKKSVSTISEQSFINNQMYPLIDPIKETITNPKYLIQEAALDGWTRGGSVTRSYGGSEPVRHLPNKET